MGSSCRYCRPLWLHIIIVSRSLTWLFFPELVRCFSAIQFSSVSSLRSSSSHSCLNRVCLCVCVKWVSADSAVLFDSKLNKALIEWECALHFHQWFDVWAEGLNSSLNCRKQSTHPDCCSWTTDGFCSCRCSDPNTRERVSAFTSLFLWTVITCYTLTCLYFLCLSSGQKHVEL